MPSTLSEQTEWTRTLVRGPKLSKPLSETQCHAFVDAVLAGEAHPTVLAALAATWRVRGESAAELAALSQRLTEALLEEVPDAAQAVWALYPAEGVDIDLYANEALEIVGATEVMTIGCAPTCYPRFGSSPDLAVNLRSVLPDFVETLDSLQPIGLRTVLHTLVKAFASERAAGVVKGITHPPYGESGIESMRLQGVRSAVILQSKSGVPEIQPERRHRIWHLCAGQVSKGYLFEQGRVPQEECARATASLWESVGLGENFEQLQHRMQHFARDL